MRAGATNLARRRRRPTEKNRRGPGRPAGSTGEGSRRAVLEAALEAFGRRGYDGTSVRDLARDLGVSHNLVHHHYGSKEALWKAALRHGFASSGRELVALVESASRRQDWEAGVRACVAGAVTLLARRPAVARILADESARGGPRLDYLFENYMKPFPRLLAELLESRGRTSRPDVDPRVAMLFLFSGMTALFTLRGLAARLGDPSPTSDPELARYAATVARLITHGLAAPVPARSRGAGQTGGSVRSEGSGRARRRVRR